MLGKITVLHKKPNESCFQVDYGIPNNRIGILDYEFVVFNFEHDSDYLRKTYVRGGHHIENTRNDIKKIILKGSDLEVITNCEDEKEDYLMVIIPKAWHISSKAEKVAGRYPDEGVFVMLEGETITIEASKELGAPSETYMVARAGKELFLVKLNRV